MDEEDVKKYLVMRAWGDIFLDFYDLQAQSDQELMLHFFNDPVPGAAIYRKSEFGWDRIRFKKKRLRYAPKHKKKRRR